MKRIVRIAKFSIELFLAYICAGILKIINKKYRNLWIISERGDDARDNGFFFYRYLLEKHPDQNIVYVISKKSVDLHKIEELNGRWVDYQSFGHYIAYAASKVRLSSSAWGGDLPCASYFAKLHKWMYKKRQFVYLQHGIMKDYDPPSFAEVFHPDIFICGAKPEYEYVRNNFHHKDGVVQYTGLARFDNLHDITVKPQILIMPTFRTWLQKESKADVELSEYVERWNAVINDQRLIDSAEAHGLQIVFYPHYVMQKYIDYFHSRSKDVIIADQKNYDVQNLLIESRLLVTDFSSVFFDFGYMKKPVLYYQFDRERYIHEHYDFTKGYFSYDDLGFGKVAFQHNDIIRMLIEQIDMGFKLQTVFQNRINAFFELNDTSNCERIYQCINQK